MNTEESQGSYMGGIARGSRRPYGELSSSW